MSDLRALVFELSEARTALAFHRGRKLAAQLTRRELGSVVKRVAATLHAEHGVRRGDRVAVVASNGIELPVALLAVAVLGAAAVPLDPTAGADERAFVLEHAEPRVVLVASDLRAAIEPLVAPLAAIELEVLVASAQGEPPDERGLAVETAIVLYTSGTTGRPKGVSLTHANLLANARAMARRFGLEGTTQLAMLPLYHAHALGFGLLTSLVSRGTLALLDRFDPLAFRAVAHDSAAEVASVVPTFLPALVAARVRREQVPALRTLLVSSAPLARDAALAFEDATGLELAHGWGLSESTNFACATSPLASEEARRAWLSAGDVPSVGTPLDGTDVVVRDAGGRELGEGERGELWVRGPSTMRGYFRDDGATREAIVAGWLRTGDEGYFRERGGARAFYVSGRLKELIVRDGEKQSPLAIERAIVGRVRELDGRLVVVGFPHREHGEEVGAYVESTELPERLRDAIGAAILALPVAWRPKVVLHGGAPIPRTHTGKVQRRRLVEAFASYSACRGATVFAQAFSSTAR